MKESIQKPAEKTITDTSIEILLGTESKVIHAADTKLSLQRNINPERRIKPIIVDFDEKIPPSQLASLGIADDGIITTDIFVPSNFPANLDELARAEKEGFFDRLPEDFYKNPGAGADWKGSSGKPNRGYTAMKVNAKKFETMFQKRLQQAKDYDRHNRMIIDGVTTDSYKSRVNVNIYFSAVGGTGSGAVFFIINRIIRKCAKQNDIEVKVILHMMLRGNLFVNDPEQADINTFTTIKYAETLAAGSSIDSKTGQMMPVPFDMIYVYQNLNSSGNINGMGSFLSHQAHVKCFYSNTPAGRSLQVSENDIGNISYDKYESPAVVSTKATASIGRDSERQTKYCAYLTSAQLTDCLTVEGSLEKIASFSSELIRQIRLVESDEENLITDSLSRPEQLAGESVFQRPVAGLSDRVENTSGVEKADILNETANNTINNDVPAIYRPAIIQQARTNCESSIERIESTVKRLMCCEGGLWDSRKLIGFIRIAADSSHQSLSEKIAALTEQKAPHEAIIAEAVEQLEQIRQQTWITKVIYFFYNFFVVRSICATLEQSARALIRYTLELELCYIAIEHFLEPLTDYLDNKFSRISSTWPKLAHISQCLKNKAADLAASETILQTPVGYQFTTARFLNRSFEGFVLKNGGIYEFTSHLCSVFLKQYGSFETIINASAAEITDHLEKLYIDLCEPYVKSSTVADIVRTLPLTRQKALFASIVEQSEGRLPVTGPLNSDKTWIKAANVPSERDAGWIREMLESIDRKGGKWEIAVNNDIDNITIAQITGGFTFELLLKNLDIPDTPEFQKKLVQNAVEPGTVLFVGPNPNVKKFKLVLAKAFAAELLTVDGDGNFFIKWFTDEEIKLGSSSEAVHQMIQPKSRQLIFIQSAFLRDYVVDEKKIIAKLQQLMSQLQGSQSVADKRLDLIDADAVRQCLAELEILESRMKRLRKFLYINE